MRALHYLMPALLLSCTTQRPEARPSQEIRISFRDTWDTPGWRPWHFRAVAKGLARLDSTGYRWVVTTGGTWDLQVRTFDARGNCEEAGGRYELGRPYVEVDPACVQTAEQLRFVVLHECMHWFTYTRFSWSGHVCRRPEEVVDCMQGLYGESLLNPTIQAATDETFAYPSAELSSTDQRLFELLRGRNAR